MSDFRLTSLVGCLHKVLVKVLANRLKTIIEKVILDTQLTFVKGRQIFDDILIVNEVMSDARKAKEKVYSMQGRF